jgi:hypothetical protein
MTWAELRTRAFLKSILRESRTPRSVRGVLGNCQSYRDGRPNRIEKSSAIRNGLSL